MIQGASVDEALLGRQVDCSVSSVQESDDCERASVSEIVFSRSTIPDLFRRNRWSLSFFGYWCMTTCSWLTSCLSLTRDGA